MDDGVLIEQVSGRYKNNKLKENAWLTISHILEETPEACEHRCKALRNKYTGLRREIKNTPSGSRASQITWPYFKMMGFLDKYLQTRKSYSNIQTQKGPESSEWNSVSQIIVEHDQENKIPELNSPHSESQENESIEIDSQSDGVSSIIERCESVKPCSSRMVVTPKRTVATKQPTLKRCNENEIPRHTIPTKKVKTSEVLEEKISGCIDTFNKVLEKNTLEHQPTPVPVDDDEHFARSLAADMSIFSRRDKIVLKKKIYQVISDHLESTESDWHYTLCID